jgi:hypothetical protein
MNIELADASQTLLKISWNPYDAALEVEIVNRLNTIPGATGFLCL